MKYLTIDEQKQLVKTVKETKGAERDYLIIELLLNTGLRASELVAVTVGDVRNKLRLYVRPEDMKRGRGRFVQLNVRVQDLLRKWLAHKMDPLHESIEDLAPLFVTRLGKRLTKRSLQYLIEKWVIKAGLTTSRAYEIVALYSTHSLRHTFAKRMQERGVPLTTIQKILGHASLASTGVYTEATDQEVEEAVHVLTIGATRAERMAEAL
jgi:site-specific recombinase XerD